MVDNHKMFQNIESAHYIRLIKEKIITWIKNTGNMYDIQCLSYTFNQKVFNLIRLSVRSVSIIKCKTIHVFFEY